MRITRHLVTALVAVLVVLPARSEVAATNVYLPADSVNAGQLVPPPPHPGDPAFGQQMAVVLWMQRIRTEEQVAFVSRPLNVERFAHIVSDNLFEVDARLLKTTIDAAIGEVRADYDALKAKYDLPRPFQVNDPVEPVVDVRPVESYPSGHSIRAIVYARLLAAVFPAQEGPLLDYALRVGYGRVVAGVHYPMDVITGQKLGHAYADVIVEQDAFADAVSRIIQAK